MRRIVCILLALVCVAGSVVACSDDRPSGPEPVADSAVVSFSALFSSSLVTLIVVEVTAPDIDPPLVFNFPVEDRRAAGTLTIPAGQERTIEVSAFDGAGTRTHAGQAVVDLVAGVNPTLRITLSPLTGELPIEISFGSFKVAVRPAADTVPVGDSANLVATVIESGGDTVDAVVTWATLNPGIARISPTGARTATAVATGPGATSIVAVYAGIAATSSITVLPNIRLDLLVDGLADPVYLTAPPDDSDRLFVVLQAGVIRVLVDDVLLPTPFLDISGAVRFQGERGLLSMAFHPQYSQNGRFFVYFTNQQGDTRVVRYVVSADPNVADGASGDTILSVPQPFGNHNGGLLAYGPGGMLHVGLGDGGSRGDPEGNGQDSTTLLGSILRIDPDAGTPYAIPADNPFLGHSTAREEILAYGLRNPWRYSFDRLTGDLYIADVGQNLFEEINVRPAGEAVASNYGWNRMEATSCFSPATNCNDRGDLVLPIAEYSHDEGCSVTGGYVYRGSQLPELYGRYLYGDFCAGWIRSFVYAGGAPTGQLDLTPVLGTAANLASFGQDARGELYVIRKSGAVFRIVRGD